MTSKSVKVCAKTDRSAAPINRAELNTGMTTLTWGMRRVNRRVSEA
jgi:hypothetical protein